MEDLDSTQDEINELLLMRPESIEQLIERMSPAIHLRLIAAIELGKWEDGARLSGEQQDFCMQAVILYESKNLPEHLRTGFNLPKGCTKG